MLRRLLNKRTVLAALLTGTLLPATIVCDVPNVDIDFDDWDDDSVIIIDDGCCYDDDFYFDWWWW